MIPENRIELWLVYFAQYGGRFVDSLSHVANPHALTPLLAFLVLNKISYASLVLHFRGFLFGFFYGQVLGLLVPVSSIHYCTYTSGLSTWSSFRGLTSCEWEISSWS